MVENIDMIEKEEDKENKNNEKSHSKSKYHQKLKEREPCGINGCKVMQV